MIRRESSPIELDYFEWLCSLVQPPSRDPSQTRFMVLEILHDIEFKAYVLDDLTRIDDGLALRGEFAREDGSDPTRMWFTDSPCSVLEMLIALARIAEYLVQGGGEEGVSQWFWHMLNNIWCAEYYDAVWYDDPDNERTVRGRVSLMVDRRYDSLGNGSLFPLRHKPKRWLVSKYGSYDHMGLWTQLANYIHQNS